MIQDFETVEWYRKWITALTDDSKVETANEYHNR